MEEKGKKVKIEVSKLTLVFIFLFGLCLLIWTFIFGAWVGSKIGGKKEKLEIVTEKPIQPTYNFTSFNRTFSNTSPSNLTQDNVTIPSYNVTTSNVTVSSNLTAPTKVTSVSTNAVVAYKPEKITDKKENLSSKGGNAKQESTKYKKKEVAQIASVIKKEESSQVSNETSSQTSYYTLQVGAFSSVNSVEAFKDTLIKKGYHPFIRKTTLEGKTWYRVYIGSYSSKEEAQKRASEVKNKLGLEKVLVVELN